MPRDPHSLKDMLCENDDQRIMAFQELQESLKFTEIECANLVTLVELGHHELAFSKIWERQTELGITPGEEDGEAEEDYGE